MPAFFHRNSAAASPIQPNGIEQTERSDHLKKPEKT